MRSRRTWRSACVGKGPAGTIRASRGAWSRTQVVDGVYRLDEGAVWDDLFHVLRALGVMDLLADVQGTAIQREMVPCVQDYPALGVEDAVGD